MTADIKTFVVNFLVYFIAAAICVLTIYVGTILLIMLLPAVIGAALGVLCVIGVLRLRRMWARR